MVGLNDWDVTEARGRTRTIDFTTSEGTWMSVDVSPDGGPATEAGLFVPMDVAPDNEFRRDAFDQKFLQDLVGEICS